MGEQYVQLIDDELVALDGRCRKKIQTEVDAAKARIAAREQHSGLDGELAGLIADAVREAEQKGELIYRHERISRCKLCGRDAGYVAYKSGRQKGQPNYNRPCYLPGLELAHRFVTFKGSVFLGGCVECITEVLPELRAALVGVRAALPKELQTEGAAVYSRYDRRTCKQCGWEGHEGEMGSMRTLLGYGTFPGICPSCDAKQHPLAPQVFERLDGFVVVQKVVIQ